MQNFDPGHVATADTRRMQEHRQARRNRAQLHVEIARGMLDIRPPVPAASVVAHLVRAVELMGPAFKW